MMQRAQARERARSRERKKEGEREKEIEREREREREKERECVWVFDTSRPGSPTLNPTPYTRNPHRFAGTPWIAAFHCI